MATDLEKLVVQLSADIKTYEREMRKARGVSERESRAVIKNWDSANKRLNVIGKGMAQGLVAPLTGIAGALTVREVLRYADAWTRAKNSLSIAGVQGTNQKRVLDELFRSAQANAAPIEALTGLYGKAAQAGDVLGASQEQLIEFSDGVAIALKVAGTGANEARGALTQLGQLLGSTRVQAEEFNSVNEGARPILQAVANGLDKAGGSVSKLKQLVNDGEVSGRDFFNAFLRGLPQLRQQAAGATQTIEQGYTKIENALTRYIGQTDSSLGASQRLVQGLNALADNFDETADTALQLASIIAGALVGRSLAGMIAKIGLSGAALVRFTRLLRTAQTVARTGIALNGLAAAAGPIGVALGVAATAAFLFADSSDAAGASTESAAEKAERYAAALKRVKGAADEAGPAVEASANKFKETEERRLKDRLGDDVKEYQAAAGEIRQLVQDFLSRLKETEATDRDNPEYQKQVAGLKAVLAGLDGTVDGAVRSREALEELANTGDGAILAIARALDKVYDKLIGVAQATKEGAEELQNYGRAADGITTFMPREGVQEETRRRGAERFLTEQQALELRSQKEKEIATLTEKLLKDAKEAGIAISEAEAAASARATIEKQEAAEGSGSALSGYVDRTIGAESGGNRFAKNPRSSAEGLGQFIDSTWLDLFRRYFPGEAAQLSQAAILAMKTDAAKSKALIEAYGKENSAALRAAGISVADAADEYKLHLAHFLGPQGAINVLKAAPGTPLRNILGADQIAANPEVLGGNRTVEDAIAYGQKRAGMSTAGTQRLESRETFALSLEEYKQQIAFLKEETGLRASLNPLIEDYGRGLSTLQAAQELLNMAQEEGTAAGRELSSAQQLLTGDLSGLTPEAREQALAMRELAEASGTAQAASNQLDETQGQLRDNLGEVAAVGKDILSGFIQDLRSGKSATEALGNALGRLGDKLLDAGLDLLFDGAKPGSGGGILGSLLGSLGGIFGFADGGWPGGRVRGPGGPRGDKIPIMVSDGEHITNARSAKKYGPLLDAINNDTLARMADGGWPMRAPVMASMAAPAARGSSHDTVDIRLQDDSGRMAEIADQRIVSRSGTIINVAVQRANKGVMPAIAKHQSERASSDWRTG
ncbi:tape measure protein [Mesorhizobium sp. IMUNJ 23232]|uniref:tape measure protein n=1 Tax=Mesorhizobium sp. IMUNJ 23232 TaxID=3376064 RepID=UPI0037B68FBC